MHGVRHRGLFQGLTAPRALQVSRPPTAFLVQQVSLGLAEAFSIAMIAAGNASVQRAAPINSSLVAEAYIAGLQDTVLNCTEQTHTNLQPDSQAWFQ